CFHSLFLLSVNSALSLFRSTTLTDRLSISLHDALPISLARRRAGPGAGGAVRRGAADRRGGRGGRVPAGPPGRRRAAAPDVRSRDRKSTRLNSSHVKISYAVFCLKKKIQ